MPTLMRTHIGAVDIHPGRGNPTGPEVQQDPLLRPVLRQGEPALVKHGVVLLFVAADAAHRALIDEGNLDLHGKRLAGLIPPFL